MYIVSQKQAGNLSTQIIFQHTFAVHMNIVLRFEQESHNINAISTFGGAA